MNTVFDYLKLKDKTHPMTYVDNQHSPKCWARWVVGWAVPGLCTVALAGLAFLASCGLFPTPHATTQVAIDELRKDMNYLRSNDIPAIISNYALPKAEMEPMHALKTDLSKTQSQIIELSSVDIQLGHTVAGNSQRLLAVQDQLASLKSEVWELQAMRIDIAMLQKRVDEASRGDAKSMRSPSGTETKPSE